MNGAKNVDIHIAVKKDARSNLNAESESSQLEIREIGEKTLERETCRGEGTLVNNYIHYNFQQATKRILIADALLSRGF